MAYSRIGYSDMTAMDLVVLFSGIVTIVGFVLSWITINSSIVVTETIDLSGISLMSNNMGSSFEDFGGFIPVNLIPVAVAVLGLVLVVVGFLPNRNLKSAGLSWFGAIVAVIAILLIAVFLMIGCTPDIFADDMFRSSIEEAIKNGTFSMSYSIGPFVSMIGAAIALLACVMSARDQSY